MNKPVPPELVSLVISVTEDALFSHHGEERLLGLANFICPNIGGGQEQEVQVRG